MGERLPLCNSPAPNQQVRVGKNRGVCPPGSCGLSLICCVNGPPPPLPHLTEQQVCELLSVRGCGARSGVRALLEQKRPRGEAGARVRTTWSLNFLRSQKPEGSLLLSQLHSETGRRSVALTSHTSGQVKPQLVLVSSSETKRKSRRRAGEECDLAGPTTPWNGLPSLFIYALVLQ